MVNIFAQHLELGIELRVDLLGVLDLGDQVLGAGALDLGLGPFEPTI